MFEVLVHEVTKENPLEKILDGMNKATNEWTMRAARGECGWVCADCCTSDHRGMPDECFHGLEWCTKIIIRDKENAQK